MTKIDHVTTSNAYLGLKISATGNLNLAVNELKEKARRAFYAINKSIQIEIPMRIWLKIFQSVIEPIALYGSEVWGPLLNHEIDKWDKIRLKPCMPSSVRVSWEYRGTHRTKRMQGRSRSLLIHVQK